MVVVITALTFLMAQPGWKNYVLYGLVALVSIPIFGFVFGGGYISHSTMVRGASALGMYAVFGPGVIFLGRAIARSRAKTTAPSDT